MYIVIGVEMAGDKKIRTVTTGKQAYIISDLGIFEVVSFSREDFEYVKFIHPSFSALEPIKAELLNGDIRVTGSGKFSGSKVKHLPEWLKEDILSTVREHVAHPSLNQKDYTAFTYTAQQAR